MTTLESLSFETLMEELKKTLEALEKGDLPLEKSLLAYEEGIKYARLAEEKLKFMEGRMEEILSDGSIKPLTLPELNQAVNE